MTLKIKALCMLLCAMTFVATFAVAQNTPTLIKPTVASAPHGIAPNGIEANPSGIFFTEPFIVASPVLQSRGVYSITAGGVVSSISAIPERGGSAEDGLAIAGGTGGFTAGDVFSTGISGVNGNNDAVYKNGVLFVDGFPAVLSKHQTGLAFDTVGSFGGALIVTADTTIQLYNAAGGLIVTYSAPVVAPPDGPIVLQAATVAPLGYTACKGCLFVTAMPVTNIDNSGPANNGRILTVAPLAANGTVASVFAVTTGIPEPESIQFVTANSLSCNVGGFSYFASGYATGAQINDGFSTTGAILGWTPAQLTPFVGHYLVQNEEFTGGVAGAIYVDAGLGPLTTFASSTDTKYQLEDTAIIQCPVQQGTGCPATQGFYHKANHWPTVDGSVDGVTWKVAAKTLTIGTETYTQAQILQLLPQGALHTGGVENDLSQFIAAALNLIAGAQHTATIDGIILTIAGDLSTTNIFSPPPLNIPAQAQADLIANGDALDDYNSAVGLKCQEGSGLSVGN